MRYLDVLPGLVHAYNHRSIQRVPAEVRPSNVLQIWKTLFGKQKTKDQPTPKFHTEDRVRIGRRSSPLSMLEQIPAAQRVGGDFFVSHDISHEIYDARTGNALTSITEFSLFIPIQYCTSFQVI